LSRHFGQSLIAANGWRPQKASTTISRPWRTSLLAIWDIRQRFQWCQVNIRADENCRQTPRNMATWKSTLPRSIRV